MSDARHRPMSFENIQAMRAAIDMVMQATKEAKPRAEVAGVVSHFAYENNISASALANLALDKLGFLQRVSRLDEPEGLSTSPGPSLQIPDHRNLARQPALFELPQASADTLADHAR
jgi:hypothetical protein